MAEERLRILQMLAEGKITAEEAEKLLSAVETSRVPAQPLDVNGMIGDAFDNKYLYVQVEPKEGKSQDRVSVKVPFALLKAGLNIAGLIPKEAQEKIQSSMAENGVAFDLSSIKPDNIKELMSALEELKVDVDSEDATIQVFCR